MIDMIWIEGHQGLLLSLAGLSVLMFVGSLIALPILLARIPEDYFVDPKRHATRLKRLHPLVYLSLRSPEKPGRMDVGLGGHPDAGAPRTRDPHHHHGTGAERFSR
jgi:hypothetical protein